MQFFIVFLLVSIALADCANNTITCSDCSKTCCSDSFWKMESCSCMCIDGCNEYHDTLTDKWYCIKKTLEEPDKNPQSIKCSVDTPIHCPDGCFVKDGECFSDTGALCKPTIGWSCPDGCTYMPSTNSCSTNDTNVICGFVEKYLLCPNKCSYHEKLNKCISSDPNYVCGLEKTLLCPKNCHLNTRGDTCTSFSSFYDICQYDPNPHCVRPCRFNAEDGKCWQTNVKYVELTCTFGQFNINLNDIKQCSTETYDDICHTEIATGRPRIIYPSRYIGKFDNIKCTISQNMTCDGARIERVCKNPW